VIEEVHKLSAIIVPSDTQEMIDRELEGIDRTDPIAVQDALRRREDRRLAEARAAGAEPTVAATQVAG
jgi:hypothetical protein